MARRIELGPFLKSRDARTQITRAGSGALLESRRTYYNSSLENYYFALPFPPVGGGQKINRPSNSSFSRLPVGRSSSTKYATHATGHKLRSPTEAGGEPIFFYF